MMLRTLLGLASCFFFIGAQATAPAWKEQKGSNCNWDDGWYKRNGAMTEAKCKETCQNTPTPAEITGGKNSYKKCNAIAHKTGDCTTYGGCKITQGKTWGYVYSELLSSVPTTYASTGACFHGDGALLLESGATKKFSELSIGDVITTSNGQGVFSLSPVLFLPHKNNTEAAAFLSLTTETNKKVDMTSDHFISKCDQQEVTAGELEVGDCLITVDGKETLMEISSTAKSGVFTAITQDEFIVVNGVVVSPFSKDSDPGKPELDYKKYRLELQQARERKLAVRMKKHQERMLGRTSN